MVNVTLSGKPYQCASCKEELTIGQYERILKEWEIDQPDLLKRDYFKLFNILTNTDCKFKTDELETQQAIWDSVSWVVGEQFAYSKELPKVLQIGDKVLTIPKKIGSLSIGQNIIVKQIIDNCKYLEEGISMAVAVYLQPEYDKGKTNLASAWALQEQIKSMPAPLIYPIGFFLLSRADKSGSKQEKTWHRMKSSLNSSLSRVLPKWLKSTNYGNMSV